MDFAAMKRRELQALCKRHGLAAGGTNADLVARLTATLSSSGGAAQEAVGVVVGKGCLKRSAGGASGGDSDAAKKVSFELEEDEEAEVGVSGRGRRRSQVMSSPAVAKTRGRGKAGEASSIAKGSVVEPRRTRSQAGGDSADDSDSGEAGADAPVRWSVTRKNSAKAEQQEVDVGDAAGRKHQLKRKTRENDIADVDVSGQVGASRRSTRSSSHLIEPAALLSPVEKKRGRRKAADVNEKTCAEEQPTEALHSGRTLRSGVVVVAPVPPTVSESKKGRWKVQEEEPAVEKVVKVEVPHRTTRSSAVAEEPAVEKVDKVEVPHRTTRSSAVEEEPAVEKVAKVEVPRRATRSSAVAAPLTSPSVTAKKRGRKTDDVHSDGGPDKKMEDKRQSTTRSSIHHLASTVEEASIEQVSKVEVSRRTTRSSAVASPLTSPSLTVKKRGRKTDDVHSDGGLDKKIENKRQSTTRSSIHHLSSTVEEASIEHVAKVDVPCRTTRSSVVAAPLTSPSVTANKRGRMTDYVHSDGGPDKKMENKRQSTNSSIHHLASTVEEASIEQVAAPSKGHPPRRSTRNTSEANLMLNSNATKESSNWSRAPAEGNGSRRSTRKSVVPSSLEHETDGMVGGVEKKQTVIKPVGRSTRRSVAPVILEKESKGLTKEIVPEAHVRRQTRKSVVPAMLEKGRKSIITEIIPEARVKRSTLKPALPMVNSENNDHCEVVSSENLQRDKSEELEKQPTVKQPLRRLTRKSAVPAMPENERKGVPDMLNNENSDRTEVQSDKAGHLEKQLVVKDPVRKSTGKSVVPDVTEEENKSLHEELKSEVPVGTPVCKSVVPNAVNKENKDHNEFVRTEELSVKTRTAHTRLQVALQNDQSLRRTTRNSSKLAISPSQSKPTASKGRPAKRRRTVSLQEDMPAEEQNEDQIDHGDHTNDVIEVATSTDLAIGVLPFSGEKTNLPDLQLNSELEGMAVVEPGLSRNKEDSDSLVFQLEGTVGTTEKPSSSLPIPDCELVGSLSEEAVHSIENDAGRCSTNSEQSPTGIQFIFSQGIAERSATHNATPCPDNSVEESDVLKVECRVETVVSSKSDLYQRSDENSVRVEEIGGCTFSSQQNNEHEGFSVSSCSKYLVASTQLDLSGDADHVVRDVITKDLICEEEKKDFIPSDINVPHEISPADEPAENASGVSGAVFCISQSTPNSDEVNSDSSRLESPGALENHIASSNTEAVQQDNKEECNVDNGVTGGINASGMSEAAQVEVSKSGKMLLPDVETSAFRDAQLNRKREGNEFEEDSFRSGKDESGKNNMSQLADEYAVNSCQEQELKLPHDLSAVKSSKGSTTCQDEFVIGSGVGRTSGSIVKGNNIAMDAPGTAKQGDTVSPSATSLLRIRENTPASKINSPELSSDHLSTMDSSSRSVQSLSGILREEGLAVGNHDDKRRMEQVQQDDVQVLEGTIENAALGSATPESNQRYGLSEEAEPHSLKSERCSSTVEQSPFGLWSLLSQNDLQVQKGTLEKTAIVSATPVSKDEYRLPDKAELHSLRNVRCSSSVVHSPFRLQSLFSPDDIHVEEGTLEATQSSSTPECGLPDEAGPHTFVKICSSSVEQSPFCLQSLFSQDDVHVQDGTLEKAAPGSATPDCKHECDEAEPHSSIVEQSPFGLQSLFSQDDAHVQGTIEKAALGSVTPECKHECGLPGEAEPHPSKNETCSTSVEQSPSGLQLLFSQKSIEEPSENAALAVHAKNGVDEPKEIHVEYGVEKTPMPESVSDHVSSVDFSAVSKSEDRAYTSDQGNEYEGLTKSCHEQEQIACQLDLLGAANCMKDFTNPEEVSYDEENKKPVHSIDISSSCEKLDANGPVKHASGLGDVLLSSSLIASTDDTDLHPSSNPSQFESTDFLDAPKGCSSTEALQQGLKEQSNEPKENQIEPDTAKCLESEVPPLPAEETSNMLEYLFLRESSQGFDMHGDVVLQSAENEDDSNTCHVELQVEKTVSSEPDSSKDMHCDLVHPSAEDEDDSIVCHAKLQVEKMDSSEPDSHQGSHEDLTIVEGISGCIFSSQLEHEKDEHLIAPLLAAETSALPEEQANPELEAGEFEKCYFSTEDTSSKIGTGNVKNNLFQLRKDYHMEAIQGKELPDDLPAPKFPEQSTAGQDAETLPSPDEKSNPELEGGEIEESRFGTEDTSGMFGTGYVGNNLFQLHEDSRMDSVHRKELPNGPDGPKSLEQSTIGQDAETSPLPDEQSNPELEGGEVEERNFEDASGIFDTGYVRNNLFQLHENFCVDSIQGKELPNGPDAPNQSTLGQDAETSPLPNEQSNPKLGGGEVEEHNFGSEDTSGLFGTGYVRNDLFQLHEDSRMDSVQGKELPEGPDVPKFVEQSTIGPDAETSALPDEQPNSELEGGEVEEHNFSSEYASGIFGTGYMEDNLFQLHEYSRMDPIQGKELPNYLHAPKSPKQSLIGRDDNVLGSETSTLPDEKFDPVESEELKEHNHSCDKAASDIFSSGSVKKSICHWDDEEECNEHSDDRATAAMLSSGMTKPTLIEGSESGMALLSAAGTPALTDEQLNSKLISDTGLLENSNLFSLPEDACTEICYEDELPICTPAAKSAEESPVRPDGSVPGSVGTCQTSGRGRISEISKKLLRFKISSTVKGSYIAMDSASTKQVDSPSLISLPGNTENVPATNPDHPAEPNTDWLDVTDSSRQGTTDGL